MGDAGDRCMPVIAAKGCVSMSQSTLLTGAAILTKALSVRVECELKGRPEFTEACALN